MPFGQFILNNFFWLCVFYGNMISRIVIGVPPDPVFDCPEIDDGFDLS